jgi:RNA-binding protein
MSAGIPVTLTAAEIRKLKAAAQRLEPVVRIGKGGLTAGVLREIEQALTGRALIKIRLDHERDERDALAGRIAEGTGAALIMQVGKVAVFHRKAADPAH